MDDHKVLFASQNVLTPSIIGRLVDNSNIERWKREDGDSRVDEFHIVVGTKTPVLDDIRFAHLVSNVVTKHLFIRSKKKRIREKDKKEPFTLYYYAAVKGRDQAFSVVSLKLAGMNPPPPGLYPNLKSIDFYVGYTENDAFEDPRDDPEFGFGDGYGPERANLDTMGNLLDFLEKSTQIRNSRLKHVTARVNARASGAGRLLSLIEDLPLYEHVTIDIQHYPSRMLNSRRDAICKLFEKTLRRDSLRKCTVILQDDGDSMGEYRKENDGMKIAREFDRFFLGTKAELVVRFIGRTDMTKLGFVSRQVRFVGNIEVKMPISQEEDAALNRIRAFKTDEADPRNVDLVPKKTGFKDDEIKMRTRCIDNLFNISNWMYEKNMTFQEAMHPAVSYLERYYIARREIVNPSEEDERFQDRGTITHTYEGETVSYTWVNLILTVCFCLAVKHELYPNFHISYFVDYLCPTPEGEVDLSMRRHPNFPGKVHPLTELVVRDITNLEGYMFKLLDFDMDSLTGFKFAMLCVNRAYKSVLGEPLPADIRPGGRVYEYLYMRTTQMMKDPRSLGFRRSSLGIVAMEGLFDDERVLSLADFDESDLNAFDDLLACKIHNWMYNLGDHPLSDLPFDLPADARMSSSSAS